jgi:hypothetical protein
LEVSKALCSAILILEANEGKASGSEVFIEGDLAGLDPAELGESIVKIFVGQSLPVDVLGELDEDVVGLNLGLGLSSEILVEGESS